MARFFRGVFFCFSVAALSFHFDLEDSFPELFALLAEEGREEEEEADESFFRFAEVEGEGEEEVILASSANKAGARVLTTASRSDA